MTGLEREQGRPCAHGAEGQPEGTPLIGACARVPEAHAGARRGRAVGVDHSSCDDAAIGCQRDQRDLQTGQGIPRQFLGAGLVAPERRHQPGAFERGDCCEDEAAIARALGDPELALRDREQLGGVREALQRSVDAQVHGAQAGARGIDHPTRELDRGSHDEHRLGAGAGLEGRCRAHAHPARVDGHQRLGHRLHDQLERAVGPAARGRDVARPVRLRSDADVGDGRSERVAHLAARPEAGRALGSGVELRGGRGALHGALGAGGARRDRRVRGRGECAGRLGAGRRRAGFVGLAPQGQQRRAASREREQQPGAAPCESHVRVRPGAEPCPDVAGRARTSRARPASGSAIRAPR